MGLRKILRSKSMKLLTLLLLSMLISTASAAIYYSMTMQVKVTIGPATVIFGQGADWPTGSTMGTNSTYVSLVIKAYPNATLTYDEPVVLNNTDASAHDVRFRHVSITPNATASVGNFTFINFTLNGQDFDYYTSGDNWVAPSTMGWQNLTASTEWPVKIETRAVAGAWNATTCTIVIAVDVRE